MPRLSACLLLLALSVPALHALTLPPECALMDCVETCGFLPDGSVGCIPSTTPSMETLPPGCAATLCEFGSTCGLREDGTVGCLPGVLEQCPPDDSGCICTEEFNPTPCCKNGLRCDASNPCYCKCGGGVPANEGGTCAPNSTCSNVRCGKDKPVCVETEDGPRCVAKTCTCTMILDWTCCERKDGSRYDAGNPCMCKCNDTIVSRGRCKAGSGGY